IQNAVERRAISQIHTNGELAPIGNFVCSLAHSATLLHSRSPFHCALSTFQHWERIASRRRPAFSSHLVLKLVVSPFYERGKSREKVPRRLEEARIFDVLSSPRNVGRLWGFWFLVDSFCGRDGASGF